MATGGGEQEVDKCRTCSICLESFKGRKPKILSCSHTFCYPCLVQLAERETTQTRQVQRNTEEDEEADQQNLPVCLTCPSCRTCITLPPGGVSQLQTNFYLEEDRDEDDPQLLLCDLCGESQKALYHCTSCIYYFCGRCRRCHDKLCKSTVVSAVRDRAASTGTTAVGKDSHELVQMMEEVLKKLAEQEKTLATKRRTTEHDIHARYATLLHHAAEAHEMSLISLRDVTQVLSDGLQSNASQAREILNRMKDQSERHSKEIMEKVVPGSTRRHFEQLLTKKKDEALLKYKFTDCSTDVLLQTVRAFMSTVVATEQHSDDTMDARRADHSISDGQQPPGRSSQTESPGNHTVDLPESVTKKTGELTSKLEDLSEKVIADLQAQNALLRRDLVALQDKTTTMSVDFTALQKVMASLMDDLASQRRDLVCVRDKNSQLNQENHIIRSDVNSLQTDRNKLQADHDKLQADHDKLQSDHGNLQADHDKLQADNGKLQADHDKLQADQKKVEADVDELQTDQRQLEKDRDTMRSEIRILRTDMGQVQDLVKKSRSAIATLETQLTKLNVHVAFHAFLNNTMTVSDTQTIICEDVIANVAGGYNSQTGVFTAPVSGTYCFMASTSANSDDDNDIAALNIVLEDQEIGYLHGWGGEMATGQCVVQLQAGQTVRLRSYHVSEETCLFAGGWLTSFTGMLLQPEL